MKTPRFQHLSGIDLWRRCDFEGLQLHLSTASVQLATREQVDGAATGQRLNDTDYQALRARRGGAQHLCCPPDRGATGYTLLADPQVDLLWRAGDGWQRLTAPRLRTTAVGESDGATRFGAAPVPATGGLFAQPAALAADPFGRLWLLERGAQRVRLLAADDLRPLASQAPPAGARFDDLAACAWGLLACDLGARRLWRQRYGGEWEALDAGAEARAPVAVGGHPLGPAVVLLRAADPALPHGLLRLADSAQATFDITDLDDPLHLLLAEPERLYLGEAQAPAERPAVAGFSSYRLEPGRLAREEQWETRGFDGRALFVGPDCRAWASTAQGARPLVAAAPERVAGGQLETFALDSETLGCQWHRVFVDACLPPGTALEVSVRCADALPDPLVQRPARPPHGLSALATPDEEAVAAAWQRRPLGSRTPREAEGWQPLGVLDERPYQADIALPPVGRELPSEDAYGPRLEEVPAAPMRTLEGLVKNPPGRYLWLRLRFSGSRRSSPLVRALRVSHCRPSMLRHLPAYWSADPDAGQEADRALALIEGAYTELNRRIDAFHQLLDPRVCPPEAIDWLAGFVAQGFDSRIGEAVRRQLLQETVSLYRQRGTRAGLERLCAILTRGRVAVVESFRLRQRSPATLAAVAGREAGALGSLQLGTGEAGAPPAPGWEAALVAAHNLLLARRAAAAEQGGEPCPPGEIPPALDPDPQIAFYRRFAHRFSVVLFSSYDAELAAVVEAAVEAWKPAHTLHSLCWLDAGLVVGSNSYVGLGTGLGGASRWRPALLGSAPLGRDATLARPAARPAGAIRLDASRIADPDCRPQSC